MLTKYRLTLTTESFERARPEWGYRLYSALLELSPTSFGASTHQDGVTPVSQFLTIGEKSLYWTVNLLGNDSKSALAPMLEEQSSFYLSKDGVRLVVAGRTLESVPDVDALFEIAPSTHHRLDIRTPAAFKSRGEYINLPSTRLILQSLIKKWNGCFPECPIEDEGGEGLEAMAGGLRLRNFRLHDKLYYLKGNSLPGFVGTITLENRLDGFHRQLADALMAFSGYSGIGIKTALGMGGVEIQKGASH